MKQFYYKKEDSLDKTPIILHLDRRRTVNINRDGVKQEVGKYIARSTSISSLDQLREIPTLPRARIRAATQSLSEDIFSNYSTPSTVLITETDLSSSWLYKNMKAVAYGDEKGYETPRTSSSKPSTSEPSLSPVMLQDPKMKPVPVPTKPRKEKTASCCCYMAIMIVIGICTLGFMSTIGGIIYLEVFANKSSSVKSSTIEIPTNTLDPLRISQAQDITRATEFRNKAEHHGSENEPSQRHGSEDIITSDRKNEGKTIHFLDFGKPLSTELTQFIDKTRTEIRLDEDDSMRYEKTQGKSVKHDENTNVARHIVDSLSNDLDNNKVKMEGTSSQSESNLTVKLNEDHDELNDKINEDQEELDEKLNEDHKDLNKAPENLKGDHEFDEVHETLNEGEEKLDEVHENLNKNLEKLNDVPEKINDVEASYLNIPSEFVSQEKSTEKINEVIENELLYSEQTNDVERLEIDTNSKIHDSEIKELKIEVVPQKLDSRVDVRDFQDELSVDSNDTELLPVSYDQQAEDVQETLDKSHDENGFVTEQQDIAKSQSSTEEHMQFDHLIESNDDQSVIEIIDEPLPDVSSKETKVFSNRNGNMPFFNGNWNSRDTARPLKIISETKRPVLPFTEFPQRFQHEIPQRKVVKKPAANIKVSLAEAMKHLQVLDVKMPSFRTKLGKPKVKPVKPMTRTDPKKRKEMAAIEQKRYLQKLRLILYDQML